LQIAAADDRSFIASSESFAMCGSGCKLRGRTFSFAFPKPHARPAIVLGDELDADARHSGASDIPSRCQQPKKQQQKIQENKRSEKANSPICNARRPGAMSNNG